MNENGYIRKIDELGRIVIPKELRQRLKIHDGENLIINCLDKSINLSKYSYIENNINFIKSIGDKTNLIMGYNVIITDLEHIIYSSNNVDNTELKKNIINYINSRETKELTELEVNKEVKLSKFICIEPIISNSVAIGLVIVQSDNKNDYLVKFCKLLSVIISTHIG